MRVVSSTGLPVLGFDWTWGPRRERCYTIVAKLTYALAAGRSELATRHEPIATRPVLDAKGVALLRPCDVVPFKQRADVLLTGLAFPPGPGPFAAKLVVGSLRRRVELPASNAPVTLAETGFSNLAFSPGDCLASETSPASYQVFGADRQATISPAQCDVTMENLHATSPVLRTSILGHALVARPERRPDASFRLLPDTLVFDTEAATCTVTFRASRTAEGALENEVIVVELAAATQSAAESSPGDTGVVFGAPRDRTLPFKKQAPEARSHPPSFAPPPPPVPPSPSSVVPPAALPSVQPPPPSLSRPESVQRPAYEVASPRVDPRPPSVATSSAPSDARAASDLAAAADKADAARAKPRQDRSVPRSLDGAPSEATRLEILWLDKTKHDAVRAAPALASLFGPGERRVLPSGRAPHLAVDAAERDLTIAILQGQPATATSFASLREEAVEESGRYRAPVVVVAGDLTMLFDERLRLEGAIANAQGTFSGSKPVRDIVATAQSVLDNAWSPAPALDHALEQIRDAVGRVTSASLSLFDAQLERGLLERRAYRKRTAVGAERLRFDMVLAGGATVPAYLPATLADHLPLCRSFPARALAEVHFAIDAFDAPAECLLVCALGRRLDRAGKNRG